MSARKPKSKPPEGGEPAPIEAVATAVAAAPHAWVPSSSVSRAAPVARNAFVVDDHPMISAHVVSVIQRAGSGVACHTASSLSDAKALMGMHFHPRDYVFVDLRLGDARGFEAVDTLCGAFPEAIVCIVSGSAEPMRMRRAFSKGIPGFIPKNLPGGDFEAAVSAFLREGLWYPLSVLNSDQAANVGVDWPERDIRIVELIADGRADKEIARILNIPRDSVRWRLRDMYERFDLGSRGALLKYARDQGVVD